jgi:hypothetical protein
VSLETSCQGQVENARDIELEWLLNPNSM